MEKQNTNNTEEQIALLREQTAILKRKENAGIIQGVLILAAIMYAIYWLNKNPETVQIIKDIFAT